MTNPNYETMVIVDAMISDDAVKAEFDKIEKTILANDGEIRHIDDWGKRKMAYDIRKKSHGNYGVFYYTASAGVVEALEKQFRINENILRWMTLKDQPVNEEFWMNRQGQEAESAEDNSELPEIAESEDALEETVAGGNE